MEIFPHNDPTFDATPYVAGRWYMSVPSPLGAGVASTANVIRLYPFFIRKAVNIDQLGARVTTLAAGGNFQLAIYRAHPTTGLPTGAAVASTGNMSSAAATAVAAAITGGTKYLAPGMYWMAVNHDNATAVMTAHGAGNPWIGNVQGSATQTNISSATGTSTYHLSIAQAFGTWPDLTAGGFNEVVSLAYAVIMFRVA